MIRLRLVLVVLMVIAAQVKAQVPGFHGTVNNYGVGMNLDDGCRHPSNGQPACSQWARFRFQAFDDGTVNAPFTVSNDSLHGYCGVVRLVVRDRANPPGNILGTFDSPRFCIAGKDPLNGHERRYDAGWTFKTDPTVGQNGADLYGVGIYDQYEDTGIDFVSWLEAIKDAGDVIKDGTEVIGFVAALAP